MDLDEPHPTVMQNNRGQSGNWYRRSRMPRAAKVDSGKPPYRIPLMTEIAETPYSGLRAVSTFSGCGGSSLGYRLAGFEVLWASEFVEAARDCYRANFPTTILDERDIRQVEPQEILDAIGMIPYELDLLDGSPPCASFSTAGKREAGWGEVKSYSDTKQRTDDLFFEFARILRGIQPRAFVAENVSGLVKGTAKGYFVEILAALKDCGYRVKVKVLDAQWLGVPQQRQRCIFVGVRDDLCDPSGVPIEPAHPRPLPYRYSVREAIPWIDGAGEHMHGENRERFGPSHAVRANKQGHLRVIQEEHNVEPESLMDKYATGKEWDAVPQGGQSDKYFQLVKPAKGEPSPCVTAEGGNPGIASVCHPTERRKFTIEELKRICAFPDDFILTGKYGARWERLGRAVPCSMMFWISRTVRDEVLRRADGELEKYIGDPECLLPFDMR